MLTIRFTRVGRKKQAFFHLVAAEKSKAVQKKYVEKLGYYNPHSENGKGQFEFDKDRILHFVKNGAQMSQTVARMLSKAGVKEAGKFIEQRVTKPKKEEPKPEPTEEAPTETPEEKTEEVAEEQKTEEK
jgi:small subunit ribosomal protein S16